ncbi:Uncharacterised protein [Vibrio cholerae]|nr:Uncharacterised protein [Vibrio cholerae]CSB90390.1 Uncharacterised protein [Vibrio cholerae]
MLSKQSLHCLSCACSQLSCNRECTRCVKADSPAFYWCDVFANCAQRSSATNRESQSNQLTMPIPRKLRSRVRTVAQWCSSD